MVEWVAAAGVIRFLQDPLGHVKVTYLNNQSGHYQPKKEVLKIVESELQSHGLNLENTEIKPEDQGH